MEYVYAALILHESGEEINEDNLTGVLEAAGVDVEESRVKALVAALEDVNIEEAVDEAAAVPTGGTSGGGGGAADEEEAAEEEAEPDEEEATEEEATEEEEAEEKSDEEAEEEAGEGLGDLFG